ncbi:helix-turn-helix transcriptional regulator [Actinomycetospora corticicola]|uniref:Transcriptional regulator with XRE-family HTH domain n=1 Tax=Actinomycetospora corticicola TaxID=663602 RepID=A0A7Y9DZL1_9PSEU|nr:helix-turn-helix transcriptional regulator [Actinomycetospora corticicola]NYD38433.1 transcriptional regulator with XRE-family HTH domain [Actinomycetospora corticicola]
MTSPNGASDRARPAAAGSMWDAQRQALGAFIRDQRRLARLSLRQLSALSHISNPYLSQVERGLHVPSVRVLQAIADALDLSAETLLEHAGLVREQAGPTSGAGPAADPAVERAVRADARLSQAQKEALIAVYRSYTDGVAADGPDAHDTADGVPPRTPEGVHR